MLVLRRKDKDGIVLQVGDETINISFSKFHNNGCSVAIQASSNVSIVRSELLNRKPKDDQEIQD